MMNKAEFLSELKNEENRIGATARIAKYEEGKGKFSVIVKQDGAPNLWLSSHKSTAAFDASAEKYSAWLNEWMAA